MTRTAVVLVAACGGSKPPPPKPAPEPPVRQTRTIPIEDTEPEDGVEIVAAHGHMDPAVVEAGLAPHKAELTDCYTSRVGKRRWLGGHVTLHWDISKSGEVTAVKLAESDLGAWPIEKCLLETARAASFGKPIGGDADFTVPLDFTAKGKATPLDEDPGNKAVRTAIAKLDECAKTKGVKGPSDVTITLYVGPQGRTQSVGFASPKAVLDDAWGDCAEKHAFGWRFPDPKGTIGKVALHYR